MDVHGTNTLAEWPELWGASKSFSGKQPMEAHGTKILRTKMLGSGNGEWTTGVKATNE